MCMDAGSAGGRGGIAQPAASSNTQAADPTCNQAMKRSIMVDLENAALFHAIPRYPVRCAVHRAKSSALLLFGPESKALHPDARQSRHGVQPHAEIGAHLGEALWIQGQKEEARRIWRDAQRIEPDNAVLRETMRRFLGQP